ncbi:hypothetical protein C8R47DRAFT_788018 [Mycena vitilis]|nr:hypothetical protein C8R47DRAFT_788018 [Mycena vitilis]
MLLLYASPMAMRASIVPSFTPARLFSTLTALLAPLKRCPILIKAACSSRNRRRVYARYMHPTAAVNSVAIGFVDQLSNNYFLLHYCVIYLKSAHSSPWKNTSHLPLRKACNLQRAGSLVLAHLGPARSTQRRALFRMPRLFICISSVAFVILPTFFSLHVHT